MPRFLVLLLTSVLLVPIAPAAPVPTHLFPKNPPYYFPTTLNTSRVYEDGEGEHVQIVSKVEEVDGATVVTVNKMTTDRTILFEKMAVSASGLMRLEGLTGKLDPPMVMLMVPSKPGEKWEVKDGNTNLEGTFVAVGVETIKVPAGTFDAVKVDLDYAFGGGPRNRASYWYAPGVGLVKLTFTGGQDRVLKSFTPGKE